MQVVLSVWAGSGGKQERPVWIVLVDPSTGPEAAFKSSRAPRGLRLPARPSSWKSLWVVVSWVGRALKEPWSGVSWSYQTHADLDLSLWLLWKVSDHTEANCYPSGLQTPEMNSRDTAAQGAFCPPPEVSLGMPDAAVWAVVLMAVKCATCRHLLRAQAVAVGYLWVGWGRVSGRRWVDRLISLGQCSFRIGGVGGEVSRSKMRWPVDSTGWGWWRDSGGSPASSRSSATHSGFFPDVFCACQGPSLLQGVPAAALFLPMLSHHAPFAVPAPPTGLVVVSSYLPLCVICSARLFTFNILNISTISLLARPFMNFCSCSTIYNMHLQIVIIYLKIIQAHLGYLWVQFQTTIIKWSLK